MKPSIAGSAGRVICDHDAFPAGSAPTLWLPRGKGVAIIALVVERNAAAFGDDATALVRGYFGACKAVPPDGQPSQPALQLWRGYVIAMQHSSAIRRLARNLAWLPLGLHLASSRFLIC